jgi:predicted TIM-barrel fold metal-dependent hydrolase
MDNALECLAMRSVDVHQHLWPEAVLRVLERRSAPLKARWQDDRWRIELPGEPAFAVDPRDHDPDERARGLTVDRALVALSTPVGLEALPARDALAAVAAWQEAATALPPELGWWAAIPEVLAGDGEAELAREAIAAGAAGVCIPANCLATPHQANAALPLLNAVADAGAPVLVHPGPASTGAQHDQAWWSPATDYVAQQHAAWHTFHHAIRPELPTLRTIFAGLAGLAPLQAERTAAKGGPIGEQTLADPLTFYDTSSYGPRAVRAMATAVGIGQLVYGTDYPVHAQDQDPVREAFGEGFAQLVKTSSPNRALGYTWVPATKTA